MLKVAATFSEGMVVPVHACICHCQAGLVVHRFANSGVGLQERIVMEAKINECMADGTELPDDPAIRQLAEQLLQEAQTRQSQ